MCIRDRFKDRDPRTYVMDQVKADFDYAIANVRADDGIDYINKYVVSTVAARCMLFEGSWLTYHKNDEALKTCSDIDGCLLYTSSLGHSLPILLRLTPGTISSAGDLPILWFLPMSLATLSVTRFMKWVLQMRPTSKPTIPVSTLVLP